jgi:hypothetical protein
LIGFASLLAFLLLAIAYFQFIHPTEDESDSRYNLSEMISDLDSKEPGWRLEDIEASRQVIQDQENGALCVLAARKLLPDKWPPAELSTKLPRNLLENRLSQDQLDIIAGQLKDRKAALDEASRLETLPNGRFPLEIVAYGIAGLQNPICAEEVADLLELQLILQVYSDRCDQAWRTCLTILNCSRSIGDEPSYYSQMVRRRLRRRAIEGMLQVLRTGEVIEASLRDAQRRLNDEANFPSLLVGFKGGRASHHMLFTEFGAGRLDARQFGLNKKYRKRDGMFWSKDPLAEVTHYWVLYILTKTIEIVQMPQTAQEASLVQLSNTPTPEVYLLAEHIVDVANITRFIASEKRERAFLDCVRVALAVERFRMRQRKWPDSLNALVPEFLEEVPTDVFHDRPLQFQKAELDSRILVGSIVEDKHEGGQNPSQAKRYADLLAPATRRGMREHNKDP